MQDDGDDGERNEEEEAKVDAASAQNHRRRMDGSWSGMDAMQLSLNWNEGIAELEELEL